GALASLATASVATASLATASLATASLATASAANAPPRAKHGKHAPLILTPHPGELSALSGIAIPQLLADPEPTLRAACDRFDATIILKSSTSWMMSPAGDIRVLDGREPALGVAGSGDVLSGLTAGLLARDAAGRKQFVQSTGLDIMTRAACLHLLAGRQARKDVGWFDAFSLIPALSRLSGSPKA
ncbi:MAG: NAD(P)H-hydrate dehydratase, partial [Rectinemataceae bacterium]